MPLDEITTTTLRNRKMAKKPTPAQLRAFENSPADKREDKKGAKRMGMTQKEYEGSAADRRADIRGAVKKAVAETKGKGKNKE